MHDQAEAARLAQDYEALVSIIKQWNANRLDLFALTLPNEVRDRHLLLFLQEGLVSQSNVWVEFPKATTSPIWTNPKCPCNFDRFAEVMTRYISVLD